MNVIKRKTLEMFWNEHNRARAPLLVWFKITRKARWRHFQDTKATFGSADAVKVASGKTATVFDIGGNNVRIITLIDYRRQAVLVRFVLTHPEYDKNKWRQML
jgi:mRNA interferase HigB